MHNAQNPIRQTGIAVIKFDVRIKMTGETQIHIILKVVPIVRSSPILLPETELIHIHHM